MTKINYLLTVASLFILPNIGSTCSCGPYIETFCEAAPTPDVSFHYYILSAKVINEPHGDFNQFIEVEVLENLHNEITLDTITIWGQDGFNCGESLSYFSTDDYLILDLLQFQSPNDTFYLDGCGLNWLRLNDETVNGNIQPELNSQSYQAFKDSLMACLGLTTAVDHLEDLNETIQVFPNPIQDLLYIQSTDYAIQNIRVFSTTGQELFIPSSSLSPVLEIDTSHLSTGLYFIQIEVNGQVISKKLAKI